MYTAHEPFLDRAVLTHVDSRGGSNSGAWLYTPYLKYIPSYGLVFFDCSKFSIIFFEKKKWNFGIITITFTIFEKQLGPDFICPTCQC